MRLITTFRVLATSTLFGLLLATTCAYAQKTETSVSPGGGASPTHGHSMNGDVFNEGPRQHAYLMRGMSNVSFDVTTKKPLVQKFFNQGLAQLHGFWYFEAERSFRQAASLDPDCATAYWGMALANINNASRAKQFIKKAADRKAKVSVREQSWISALADYYLSEKPSVDRKKTYLVGLDKIQKSYPEDVEAKAFLCLNRWQMASDVPITDYNAVDAMFNEVLLKNPLHPLHHYRIHLWNYKDDKKALNSAALCGTTSPGIAHMWHMQGHTYSSLQRYSDAAWSQEASARVDHAQMIRNRVMPDQIHNYAHNNKWLVEDLCYIGRVGAALDLAKNMIELPRHPSYNTLSGGSANQGRNRLFQVLLDYELWDDTILFSQTNYLEPTDIPEQQLNRLHALGLAYFRKHDTVNAFEQVKFLERIEKTGKVATTDGEKKLDESRRTQVTDILAEFAFETALLQDNKSEAIKILAKISDKLPKERASKLWLRAGDTKKAVELAKNAVSEKKGQLQPLANYVEVLSDSGDSKSAKEQFARLRDASGWIEPEDMRRVPIYQRLSIVASELGLPVDWRQPTKSAKDIGPRPPLESLGPFRWHPTQAVDWTLADSVGKKYRLHDYVAQGKPVVAIFYLGSGCAACMEQLNAFAPLAKEFENAGISLIAIGVDPKHALKLTQEQCKIGASFPFPVVSDKDMKTFKAYGAYDDFEKMPLHGAFLIDGKGLVRWQDISFQPFKQTAFLLSEAKRLLKLPEIAATGVKESVDAE